MLFGDKGSDIIHGDDGHDMIWGGKQDDILMGGDGNDTLEGGFGMDEIDGGDGTDVVQYSLSDEAVTVNLGTGKGTGGHADGDMLENIEGVAGSMHGDMLTLGDEMMGGMLMGYKGDDTLTGGAMADMLMGGEGNDELMGGGGNDTLGGDMGDDMLMGGMGDDMLYASDGEDTLDGGSNAAGEDPDMDTVSYKHATKPITVNASQVGPRHRGGDEARFQHCRQHAQEHRESSKVRPTRTPSRRTRTSTSAPMPSPSTGSCSRASRTPPAVTETTR